MSAHAQALALHSCVHVFAPGLVRDRRDGDVFVHALGGRGLFGWPGAAARVRGGPWRLAMAAPVAWRLRRRLDAFHHFDRLVAHWWIPSAWPLLSGRPEPLEVRAHGADVRLLTALPATLRRRAVDAVLDRAERIVFASMAGRESLAEALEPRRAHRLRERSEVAPPPIALPALDDATVKALRPDGAPVALVAGRMVDAKRVDVAIDALESTGVTLWLVGDGPALPGLLARAAARGVRCEAFGRLARREALARIAACDVLLHPSLDEAAPTVVREARHYGTTVLACPAGDVPCWAGTDDGLHLVPADAAAFRDAVRAHLR